MRQLKIAVFVVSIAALAIAPACGGGGRGFRVPNVPLSIASNVFPALLSGQAVEFQLPIEGGCGGPYILNLIAGSLPDGVTLDDREANIEAPGVPAFHRRHVVGIALEDGTFQGTIEVIDTSCNPFASTTFSFNWTIGQGPVKIVAANPALIPAVVYALQEPAAFPGIDAIEPVIFNQFSSIALIAAGGVPPYSCNVIDDPLDPDDGPLPLGTSMPPNSCSIVGSPVQVGPNGNPFKLTVRVTDSVGNNSTSKFQWKVRTPPVIIGNDLLPDGICGQVYGDVFQIADGVPPFRFEFDSLLPNPNDNTDDLWDFFGGTTAPSIPGVTVSNLGPSTTRLDASDYPGTAVAGPYGNPGTNTGATPPEGVILTNQGTQAGSFTGVPRRMGQFTINLHAYSELVPNESGQHAWKPFTFNIADSESAPIIPFGINPAFTVQGVLNTGVGDTFPDLPEFSFNSVYNPDSTSHIPSGLQMLGEGGVPYDGMIDTPNTHTAAGAAINTTNSNEVNGNYLWEVVDWNPLGGNDPIPTIDLFGAPAGADIIPESDGVINTSNPAGLQRQSRQVVEFRMTDRQLPDSTTHTTTQRFGISVGPDVVIITESRKSMTATTRTSSSQIDAHDDQLVIRKLQVVAGSPQVGPLTSANDLAATHVIPADATGLDVTNPLGSLLSRVGHPAAPAAPLKDPFSIDLLRGVINASQWGHDVHGLNPRGGASMRDTDANNGVNWVGAREDSYPGDQPTASAIQLPNTATHSPSTGIYGDGGKMYPFENDNYFGLFVVRNDGKIYVPFAARRSTWDGFGDGIITDRGPNSTDNSDSETRTVQITISPNGRYAAMKLKANRLSLTESAVSSGIVFFTLDGAKDFGGTTYRITTTGAGGSLNGVLYATSMVLTDRFLYYLIGEDFGSTTLASWQDHFVMRCPILAGGGAEANGFGANWTQNGATATAMQTPFHHWSSPTSTLTTFTFTPSFTSILVTVTNNERYSYDGWNMTENSIASIPFRVSSDGTTCGLLAGTATASTSGSSVWKYHAWMDRLGAGFRQASTTTRTAREGAAMPHVLRRGANSYRHWGNYAGPSGGFELNNTGTRLAYTFSELVSVGSTSSSTAHGLGTASRMNMVAIETTDNWATGADDAVNNVTEYGVTTDKFGGSNRWKFGGLTFGKQGDKLFFFGGSSRVGTSTSDSTTTGQTANYFQWAGQVTGTYYVFDFATTTQIQAVLPTNAGGTGTATYTSASPFNPSTSLPTYLNIGDITPGGGFISQNQDFLYVTCLAALGVGGGELNNTPQRLIGINISGATVNGHTADRGFVVGNWPARRGFMPGYYYMPHYPISTRFYTPGKNTMSGTQIMAKDSGYVFFASHRQWRTTSKSNSNSGTSFTSNAEAAHWEDRGTYNGHVEGFHANVGGPIQRLTQPGLSDPTGTTRNNREISYLQSNSKGDRLAYVFSGDNSFNTSHRFDLEGIGYIRNIGFNPNGTLVSTFNNATDAFLIEGSAGGAQGVAANSPGRAAPNMSLDSTGRKLYYAFASVGNENLKQLVEATISTAAGGTGTTALRINPARRYSVLHAGR